MDHTHGDERIAEWLSEHQYHPRSPKHGSAACMYFLDDLLYESELFREAATSGEIVYQEDYTVGSGESRWNTDLVVGPPVEPIQMEIQNDHTIAEGEPESVWLAIDAKSVMTEHGKARRNRQRDINSFADIMHRHHPGAVTGGLILVNLADVFRSPLRDEGDVTEHDRIESLVEQTVEIFRDIDRAQGRVSPNVDGVGVTVVKHTNMDDDIPTELVTEPPAPQSGDIVQYHEFLDIIRETFEERWLIGEIPDFESLTENGDLRSVLDRQIVELATVANEVGEGVQEDDLDEAVLSRLRNELEETEAVMERIEEKHLD